MRVLRSKSDPEWLIKILKTRYARMCVQHVHRLHTQSPKNGLNKAIPIYEYHTCVFEEIQLGVKG